MNHLGTNLLRLTITLLIIALPKPAVAQTAPEVDPLLLDHDFLREVAGHAYHWYLDDTYFHATARKPTVDFRIHMLAVETDPGDQSRFAEIWMPAAGLVMRVKRSDYFIEELGLPAKSKHYVVISARPMGVGEKSPTSSAHVTLDRAELNAWLTAHRDDTLVLPTQTLQQMQRMVQDWLIKHAKESIKGPQYIFIASPSTVSTDLWIFWANQRLALRLSSEMGIMEPGVLEHLPLHIRAFDLRTNVVASLLEEPTSPSIISKDWAGRILYESMVRGTYWVWEP